ncbi:MAG: family 43 glycosylhydrolase, partial [Oscillospiraceae bacterium]|nr:family 43 glycosylhydrolase [Oscillospiraceae bacterium]
PVVEGVWKQASGVEPGKTYVIVADGQFALNTNEVPSVHSYANSTVTLGATAVTVAGGKITSEITEDMLWTVQAADVGPSAQDGAEQYYLYAKDGRQLLRKNVRVGMAPVVLGEMDPNEIDFATWSFCKRGSPTRAADAAFTMYSNANSSAQWPLALQGVEKGFDLTGKVWSEWDPQTTGSAIRLYTLDTGEEPGPAEAYKITAPHVVKLDSDKAEAGKAVTVTADGTISDITVQTAGGKDVVVTKNGSTFTFTMPESDVTVKTYYAADAVAALQSVRQKGNPFIPIYDFNPDTEPHVWEDPDNPGQYRFYFLSSHDMDKVHYCSTNHVLYSCPVDDPFNWTYHGVIVGPENTEHDDILYAPDMGCVEDPTSPTGKYYYYYPCNQAGGRQTMVLRSSRPDGKGDPFTVVNWEDETHNRTTGSIMTFDPSIFVDDDGKVYGYWGGYNSTCHGAQLDPATNYTTAVEGTQLDDMLGDGLRGETFGFYEASSMRKIDGVYVFVYSRQGKNEEPEGANYNQLGYAYSDSPLGPWTFGGILVDAQGEVLGWPESRERTFAGGNTHGSLVKLGDQWYVTYHRNVETYARQAMIEPVDVTVNEDGSVQITQAEMTSKGFYVNGLNPYAKVSIGTACFMTGNGKIQPLYEHDVESLPVINLRANSVVGLKYFDFNTEAPKGASTSLKIDLVPKGVNATLNVWLRPQSDLGVAPFSENCIKLGEYRLTSDLPKEKITIEIPTPAVDTVDGQWGVFYSFSDVESNGNIVELYDMQFEFTDHEHDYAASVVAPTCLEGGYTLGTCKVCGKEVRYDYTKALGHAWDEGIVTVAPTETTTGLMTYTCTRCGETMTKKLPRVGVVLPADIDFTDPADKVKYEIVNQDSAEVIEGEGVTLTPTADAFEPIGGGFGGGEATPSTPKDLIKVPVSGDWIATTRVDYNQNDVQYAFNSYFSFLAMEGEDYQNMVGIRGTNNVFQDYLRQDGAVATPTVSAPGWGGTATSGFTANGPYWLRLEKAGTSYTASWSADGETFTELFRLEDTGVNAEYLLLDAYKTSTFSFGGSASWLFTLKHLNFEDNANAPIVQPVDKTALEAAIAAAEAVDPSLYTEESVAAMQASLAEARAALSAGDQ